MPRPTTKVRPKQHNAEANPRHTPAETKKLMEHRSDHVRPESHDTSTQHPRPPRGNYTYQCHHERHQGTGYRNISRVLALDTPREPTERKPLNTAHEANNQAHRTRHG
ncbi:hypothetical protein Taro_031663 [Colocasia esculenta]|uniref:Uncharacterized protein n=1 Tax=Colocasia esculenta TaxID=4460 RepID=A0A843VX88_COLES|nr:hypothetical protein [Colocasia esculenta]